jgi:hypothetical protein
LNLPTPLEYGFSAMAAISIFSLAIVASVDVLARAYVTSAQMRTAGSGVVSVPATAAANNGQDSMVGAFAPAATKFAVRLRGRGDTPFQVVAVRPSGTSFDLLVGRGSETPQIAPLGDVEAANYS